MKRQDYFYMFALIVALLSLGTTSCSNDEDPEKVEFSEISGIDGSFRTPFVYKKALEYEDVTGDGTPVMRPYVCISYLQYYFPLDSETKVYKNPHHSKTCVAIHKKFDKNFKNVKWIPYLSSKGDTLDWFVSGTRAENTHSYSINPKQRTVTLSNGEVFNIKLRRTTNYCIGLIDKDDIEYLKGNYDDEELNSISYEEWLTQSKGK